MKKRNGEPSIKHSMVQNIILFVLMPLFISLAVLCFLLQHNLSAGIQEAFQMTFDQNVRAIDSAILQASYASSTMITYTENNDLLKSYYEADNPYEKYSIISQMEKMIANCQVMALASFNGEMMLLLNDEKTVDSGKYMDVSDKIKDAEWYEKIKDTGRTPYWDNSINDLFEYSGVEKYVVFGRGLSRYREASLGYALVRIPTSVFFNFKEDPRFQKGTMALFASDGRIITGETERFNGETLQKVYRYCRDTGIRSGEYEGLFFTRAYLNSNNSTVIYVINRHDMFARSELILAVMLFFMAVSSVILVRIVLYVSGFITGPIMFFADKVRMLEQNRPQDLTFDRHHFSETRALQEGLLQAQKRIQVLLEEVRQEATMKEKARFDALKAQIGPHFLFNTLNAIRWKAAINKDDQVADILSELGVLLGETYKNNDELETIDNAMRTLDAYVKIMQVRFGDKVQFFFAVPDQIREYMIPRFCLQPLVENSFIHGMSHMEGGIIVLRGEQADNDVILTLIDNGEGLHGKVLNMMDDSVTNKRGITGIGLPNIHKRIQSLYGGQYGLTVDTKIEVGFKISLRIPVIRQEAGEKSEVSDESVNSGR